MAETERSVRAFLDFKKLVKKMAKTFDEMTDIEKWACRGYDTDKPCDLCGETPGKIDPRVFFVVCRTHMHYTPAMITAALKLQEKT